MSLDVYLEVEEPIENKRSGIFIRESGGMREISVDEWKQRFSGEAIVVSQEPETTRVYQGNITHNLNTMAKRAGIYEHLWRPDEIGIEKAHELIVPLTTGLGLLEDNPEHFKQFNPDNGWGSYEGLVELVKEYLNACKQYPNANVSVWR